MIISRLIFVLILCIAFGGAFGAAVGGLLGYAVPSSIRVFVGVNKVDDSTKDQASEKSASAKVGVDPETRGFFTQGAALGGAFGLIGGALAGLIVGAIDQLLTVLRGRPAQAGSTQT